MLLLTYAAIHDALQACLDISDIVAVAHDDAARDCRSQAWEAAKVV